MFSADEFSEGDDGIGDEFRMLDEHRGVAGNSRDQDLPGGGVSRRAELCIHARDGRCWLRSSVAVLKLGLLTAPCHFLRGSNLLGGHF
jgi:hypothetical protein